MLTAVKREMGILISVIRDLSYLLVVSRKWAPVVSHVKDPPPPLPASNGPDYSAEGRTLKPHTDQNSAL